METSKKYVVFLCRRCGFPCMARVNQKSSMCRDCGNVNELELTKLRILLRTDDMTEAQAAVQYAKTNKAKFPVKKLTPIGAKL